MKPIYELIEGGLAMSLTGLGAAMVGMGYGADNAMTVALGAAFLATGGTLWNAWRVDRHK